MPSLRRGFTLIELLVVLGIIAALLGLLIPGITLVKKQARRAKAQSQIDQIAAALASYRNVNASYPETWGSPDQYNATFMSGSTPKPCLGSGALVESDWTTIAGILNQQLNSVDRDLAGKIDITKDPWGHPYHYRPARYLPFDSSRNPTGVFDSAIDSDNPPNPDTFQLWSTGPDGKDDGGQNDDIANWKKR